MWLFISRRLRAWVLFSIAVPLVAKLVRSLSERAHASNPDGAAARNLSRADALVSKLARRKKADRKRLA